MGVFRVAGDDSPAIDFAPDSTAAEVLQNVLTIITTVKGTIPLDRNFGIDGSAIDLPMPQAQAKMTNEIFQAIKQYEPRATIESISFSGDINGRLVPAVEVSIHET